MAKRIAELAEEVGKMPAFGTIEAEKATSLIGEAVSILGLALEESAKSTARATEWAERCDGLLDIALEHIWNRTGANA